MGKVKTFPVLLFLNLSNNLYQAEFTQKYSTAIIFSLNLKQKNNIFINYQ